MALRYHRVSKRNTHVANMALRYHRVSKHIRFDILKLNVMLIVRQEISIADLFT